MSKIAEGEFGRKLEEAKRLVKVGGKYRHYKSAEKVYTVVELALLEATCEVAVVYRAEYGEKLVWVRAVEDFVGEVEFEGEKMKRFVEIL